MHVVLPQSHQYLQIQSFKQMNMATYRSTKSVSLNIRSRFYLRVVVSVQVWVFRDRVLSRFRISDRYRRVGLEFSLGLCSYEAKFDVASLNDSSRLPGYSTFLSSYSESAETSGSIGYFVDTKDSHLPNYCAISELRGESLLTPIGPCYVLLRFKPNFRNRTVRGRP